MSALPDRDVMLAAALAAAVRGWRVFPLRPGAKCPAMYFHRVDRCPRTGPCRDGHLGWEQRATTDPDRIRAAWRVAPFNVGIATGPSGLVVVDLDMPKSPQDVAPDGWTRRGVRDGHDTFALVCEQAGQPVPWDTYAVRTARHGSHLYYDAPRGVHLRSTKGELGNGLGWKVDTRAWGGYVVAAGSSTPDGAYEETEGRDPDALPVWLTTRLIPAPRPTQSRTATVSTDRLPAYIAAAVAGEAHEVAAAPQGQHTHTLLCAAIALGQLVGAHRLSDSTAEYALTTAALHMVTGPCDCTQSEVDRIIRDGLRIGRAEPRRTTPRTTRSAPFDEQGAA